MHISHHSIYDSRPQIVLIRSGARHLEVVPKEHRFDLFEVRIVCEKQRLHERYVDLPWLEVFVAPCFVVCGEGYFISVDLFLASQYELVVDVCMAYCVLAWSSCLLSALSSYSLRILLYIRQRYKCFGTPAILFMNSRYYRTRIKYLDAIKLLPDPHPLHNLPSKTRTASVLRRKINPVELEVCSKANTKKSVPKLTTARHFSGDRASMIESYNPKSWRAVRFPMLDCGSRDINADNP